MPLAADAHRQVPKVGFVEAELAVGESALRPIASSGPRPLEGHVRLFAAPFGVSLLVLEEERNTVCAANVEV
jgi:hypothetical protein